MNYDPYNQNGQNNQNYYQKNNNLTVQKYIPIVTFILVGINIIVFLMETFSGGSSNNEVLIRYGAQYTPYILYKGQWYRLFTSMFLHIGFNHLLNNMICLIAVGQYAENYFGRIKYIILYVISGLCGNLLSMIFDMFSSSPAISAGASGAISGLIGTLVVFAIDPETRKLFPLRRVLIGIVLVLIPVHSNVNILAHLGGLIGGFLTSYTMYYFSKNR